MREGYFNHKPHSTHQLHLSPIKEGRKGFSQLAFLEVLMQLWVLLFRR